MTLKSQLFIVIIVLFTLIFAGTFYLSVQNTKAFIEKQLESEANNTANSLSVSISQYATQDEAIMSALVDAVFKTGNYQEVKIEGISGETILERRLESRAEGVPSWFVDMTAVELVPGTALITSGWHQIGTIYVHSDLGIAYKELWSSVVLSFWWFLAAAIVTLLLGLLALRIILKPLKAVQEQADGICMREFKIQEKLPRTKELRRVVEAMNRVSDKVQKIFDEQTKVTEKLREQAYKDSLTGLANRRYLMMQLDNVVKSPEEFFSGALYLLELKHIAEFKKQQGYEASDKYLKDLSEILTDNEKSGVGFLASRLSDTTFGLWAPNISLDRAKEVAEVLSQQLNELHVDLGDNPLEIQIGVASYRPGHEVKELLSEADMALRAAQSKGNFAWHIYDIEELEKSLVQGAGAWGKKLDTIIEAEHIALHYQPIVEVVDGKQKLIHHEVLLRVFDEDDNPINAGIFIPMAENLGKMVDLDKLVVSTMIRLLQQNDTLNGKFAINISPSSINKKEFTGWLYDKLDQHPEQAKRLIIELPEHAAISNLDILGDIIKEINSRHAEFSLDHFGRGFSSFKYLKNLQIAYLKVDGSYIRHIESDTGNQFFIHVVTEIAHNLDVRIIAENVETEVELETLLSLNINGFQGYYIGKPQPEPWR